MSGFSFLTPYAGSLVEQQEKVAIEISVTCFPIFVFRFVGGKKSGWWGEPIEVHGTVELYLPQVSQRYRTTF